MVRLEGALTKSPLAFMQEMDAFLQRVGFEVSAYTQDIPSE